MLSKNKRDLMFLHIPVYLVINACSYCVIARVMGKYRLTNPNLRDLPDDIFQPVVNGTDKKWV